MQQCYVPPVVDRSKEPTEPGTYWARQISIDLANQVLLSMPFKAKVVLGVPNPRQHHLLVETGLKRPHHAALSCYAWGDLTDKEIAFLRQLSSQR